MEPLATALTAVGAVRVGAEDFRTLEAHSGLLRPPVTRDSQVWPPPARAARDGGKRRDWRLGVRLGPHAFGELPRRIYDSDPTPPGPRMAGIRKVADVVRCNGAGGLSVQRGDRRPDGLSGHVLPIGLTFVWQTRGQRTCPGALGGNLRPGARGGRGGRNDPRGQGGRLPMLRATNPYGDSLAICGWGVLPSQGPGSLAADRTWPMVGSLF